jgi:WD40 repeat protein
VAFLWFIFADGSTGFALRRAEQNSHLMPATFSPDGQFAVSCGGSGEDIPLLNVEAGQVERYLEGRAEAFPGFAFSADGSRVLAGSANGLVRLWNVQTGQELHRFTGDPAVQVAVSPDAQFAALAGKSNLTVTEMYVRLPPIPMRMVPDSNAIKIWNVKTGAEAGLLTGHTDFVGSVVFSPDGRRLLSGSFDGTMRLWDVAKQQEIRLFQRHTGWVTCVAFCPPDGRRAIAGYYDWSVRLWDLETGQELHCFDGHRAPVTSLAVSIDGHSFLSGSFDSTMRLWDLDGGVQRCVFRGDMLPVTSVSFSAEGRLAVSWSFDGTMRVWGPKE